MRKENMVSSVGVCWRLVLLTLVFGFVCVGISVQSRTTTAAAATTTSRNEIGREKLAVYESEMDLNYMMNKRKVPNGPDPIHNRRAGNSKRPPGKD